MMRLPHFRYLAPADLREAAVILEDDGPDGDAHGRRHRPAIRT